MDLLPLDKLLHASISANLTLGVTALAAKCGLSAEWSIAIGITTALLIGTARELFGNRDPYDMAANAVGIGAGALTAGLFLEW